MELGLCLEMIFTKDPLEKRMEKAARAGIRNGEIWFVDGSWKGTPEALAETARRHGMRLTNTVIGAPNGSVGGGLTDRRRRAEWLARARMSLDFTKRAGIPATVVCTGNHVPGFTAEEMRDSVREGLRMTADLADRAGITLLLEPLNVRVDHGGYWCAGSDAAAALCREIGGPLKLLFDVYHMQIQEGDLLSRIRRHIDVIGHFHAAGVPGRHEPMNGEINYPFLLAEISKLGYRGVFALEYTPSYDEQTSLRDTMAHLRGAR